MSEYPIGKRGFLLPLLLLLAFIAVTPYVQKNLSISTKTLTAQVGGGPTISLSPSRTSGVAPLAVFFDATGTIDPPSTSEPFRDLDYRWIFGDSGAGTWRFSGKSKNEAIGGIAGHLFTTAGTYSVQLTVTNASGQSATRNVTIQVDNPTGTFSGANTRCVSTSGNFSGCPSGAEQITSSSVNTSILNQAGKRTLYRKGETFSLSSGINLTNAGATGSILGAFPDTSSGKPTFSVQPLNALSGGTNWRVMDIFFDGQNLAETVVGVTGGSGTSQLTLYNIDIERFSSCASFSSTSGRNREIAFIDFTCTNPDLTGDDTRLFEDTEMSMFMGVEIDKGDITNPCRPDVGTPGVTCDDTEFNHRTVYFDKKIIQHNKYHGRAYGHGKNVLQLRHCSSAWGSKCITNVTKGQYVIVSDNHFIEEGGPNPPPGGTILRICSDSTCDTGGSVGHFPIENIIIERNLIQMDYDDPATHQFVTVVQAESALTTVRNNVFDLQRAALTGTGSAGPYFFAVDAHPPGYSSLSSNGNMFINNTIYLPSFSKASRLCINLSSGTGNVCSNNLVYAPGSGTVTGATTGWSQSSGNVIATTNPFSSLPGFLTALPQTVSNYFSLSGSSQALNAGAAISSMRMTDFSGTTIRSGVWDAGAFESGGGGNPPPPPPPTQVCNNNIREGTEVCDGAQLNGQSCTTQGFSGGTLSCNTSCSGYITSACTTAPPPPPPPTGSNECIDGSDNDGDGRSDGSDSGCSDINEFTERLEAPIGMNGISLARFLTNETVITFSDVFNGSASAGAVPGFTYNQTWAPMLASSINSASSGVVLQLDRNGYPTQIPYDPDSGGALPSVVARTVLLRNQYAPAGTYTLSFDGAGRIRVSGAAATQECVGAGGTTTCAISVTPSSTGIILHILESQAANPITRIAVVTPGNSATYRTQPFYPTFLSRMGNFSVIRFMETMQTNHYPCDNTVTSAEPTSDPACVATWAGRVLPTQVQSGRKGIAWEYAVDMANATQADMWINIPHPANDEYVRELARLIRDRLNRNRKVYIELSNEAWNGSFGQARYFRNSGLARGYDTNEVLAGRKMYVRRLSEIIQIFETEFGSQQNRLVRVLGSQLGSGASVGSSLLSYWNTSTYNPTGRSLNAIAVNPYFGNTITTSDTVTSALDFGQNYIDTTTVTNVRDYQTLATQYGLKLLAYEGGPHYLSDTANQTLIDVNRNARMNTLIRSLFDRWFANGGGLFMYFINVKYPGGAGGAGAFGALEYMDQPISQAPKFSALLDEITEHTTIPSGSTVTSFTLNQFIEGSLSASRTFTVAIHSTGSATALTTRTVTGTGASITVTGISLASGTYDIYVSSPGFLRRRITAMLVNGGIITPLTRLPAGDLNNDSIINSLDWSTMSTQWNTNNTTSDLNRDGIVNSIDFSFLNKNWMQVGQ